MSPASRNRPKVLLLTPLYPPAYRGGGPIRTTEALVETHGDKFDFYVITSDTDWGESTPLDVETDRWVQKRKAQVTYTRARNVGSLLWAYLSGMRLRPDFVYINSFLSPKFSILPVALSRIGLFGKATVVIAPRGEFGIAALALKGRKKQAFLLWSRLSGLHRNVIWHASSEIEAQDIRQNKPSAQVVIRLNESNLPTKAIRKSRPDDGIVRLIFISRISEIKGVKLLLEALSAVAQTVAIDLYGSAQNPGYLAECRELATKLPENVTASFKGSIENSQVRSLFAEADAFFLPTEQENFGHAIAESLSAGCPVVIGDVTPWTETVRDGGGAIVRERTAQAWGQALRDYCSISHSDRMKLKGQAADAYEKWRADHEGPSIFELVTDNLAQ
ncbi:glycosyltransferase family 4 protein [Dietzia kunjamensis]|uniref:glycosyltransferase family 4 protein n=1 Tax=Dietzia kunjamensis TaxID=322509 RepID=UPI002DB86C1D|nr:glycosyltransferase family 4 protein [Dietzia kunjamensis]MEB8325991.1 glycosyltransferase family 4 protein [Dietzia kunjamensis]